MLVSQAKVLTNGPNCILIWPKASYFKCNRTADQKMPNNRQLVHFRVKSTHTHTDIHIHAFAHTHTDTHIHTHTHTLTNTHTDRHKETHSHRHAYSTVPTQTHTSLSSGQVLLLHICHGGGGWKWYWCVCVCVREWVYKSMGCEEKCEKALFLFTTTRTESSPVSVREDLLSCFVKPVLYDINTNSFINH